VFIRIADRSLADISVHELDVFDRFHVELGVPAVAADELLRASGLGEIVGDYAWIWPDQLLRLVGHPVPDWQVRFDEMLVSAQAMGFTDEQLRLRAHLTLFAGCGPDEAMA
jgi:hypothetical protein